MPNTTDNIHIATLIAYLTIHKDSVNDLLTYNGKQETLLTYTIQHGSIDLIRLILDIPDIDIDVTKENSDGETIISLATRYDASLFIQLVSHEKIKPHLNYVNPRTGNNLIHDIIQNNINTMKPFAEKIKSIKQKLQAVTAVNIDVNLQNRNRQIPINMIFSSLANTNDKNSSYMILTELINVLNKFPHFNINTYCLFTDSITGKNTKLTPLMIAAKKSAVLTKAICSLSYDNGIAKVNANAVNDDRNSALHIALMNGANTTLIGHLIQAGSRLNDANAQGLTPLMLAGMNDSKAFSMILTRLFLSRVKLSDVMSDVNFQRIQSSFPPRIKLILAEYATSTFTIIPEQPVTHTPIHSSSSSSSAAKDMIPPAPAEKITAASELSSTKQSRAETRRLAQTAVLRVLEHRTACAAISLLATAADSFSHLEENEEENEVTPSPMDASPASDADESVHIEEINNQDVMPHPESAYALSHPATLPEPIAAIENPVIPTPVTRPTYNYSRAFCLSMEPVVRPLGSTRSSTASSSLSGDRLFKIPLNRFAAERLAPHGIPVCPGAAVRVAAFEDDSTDSTATHDTDFEVPAGKRHRQ